MKIYCCLLLKVLIQYCCSFPEHIEESVRSGRRQRDWRLCDRYVGRHESHTVQTDVISVARMNLCDGSSTVSYRDASHLTLTCASLSGCLHMIYLIGFYQLAVFCPIPATTGWVKVALGCDNLGYILYHLGVFHQLKVRLHSNKLSPPPLNRALRSVCSARHTMTDNWGPNCHFQCITTKLKLSSSSNYSSVIALW